MEGRNGWVREGVEEGEVKHSYSANNAHTLHLVILDVCGWLFSF